MSKNLVLQSFYLCIENAEFYDDVESAEKVGKNFIAKKVINKKGTEICTFSSFMSCLAFFFFGAFFETFDTNLKSARNFKKVYN